MINHSMKSSTSNISCGELDCSKDCVIVEKVYNTAGAQSGDGSSCKQASNLFNRNSKTNAESFFHLCHSNDNLNFMFGVNPNPNPKSNFTISTFSNPNPNCMERPDDCEFLEEGQGECSGDRAVSAANGLPALWDNSEDTPMATWRRPSSATATATATSSFCKDIEEEHEYFQQVLGSASYGWTDEKHSSYLDSMEADFLKSIMFRGSAHAEPSELDDSASSYQANSSKKFKVCQNGKWRPLCVQAPFVNIGSLKQLAVVVAVKNPWIKHFRASKRASGPCFIMEDPLLEEGNVGLNSGQGE